MSCWYRWRSCSQTRRSLSKLLRALASSFLHSSDWTAATPSGSIMGGTTWATPWSGGVSGEAMRVVPLRELWPESGMGLAEGMFSRTGTEVGIMVGCGMTGGGSDENGMYRASFGVGSKAAGGDRLGWRCASGVPFAVGGVAVSSRAWPVRQRSQRAPFATPIGACAAASDG